MEGGRSGGDSGEKEMFSDVKEMLQINRDVFRFFHFAINGL